MKQVSDVISPVIVLLTNLIFETGIYRDLLKIARVTPIFKSGDRKQCYFGFNYNDQNY